MQHRNTTFVLLMKVIDCELIDDTNENCIKFRHFHTYPCFVGYRDEFLHVSRMGADCTDIQTG